MREILFRGKVTGIPLYLQDKTKIGTWVYGSYVSYPVAQIFDLEDEYIVDPATVGQYTGLCDKNGKKIFEGDIIKTDFHEMKMSVCYKTRLASFALENRHWMYPHYFQEAVKPKDVEVIGNIHDTPDLVKEESE